MFDLCGREYKERQHEELSEEAVTRILNKPIESISITAFGSTTLEYSVTCENERYILIEFNPLKRDNEEYSPLLKTYVEYHKNCIIWNNRMIDIIDISGYRSISELSEYGKLSDIQAINFLNQLDDIHSEGYIHLGLTPYNIFFKNDHCKIINNDSMVLERELYQKNAKYFSTNPFSAPEIKIKSIMSIGKRADMYSAAMLLKKFFVIKNEEQYVYEKMLRPNAMRRYPTVADFKYALSKAR